MARLQPGRHLTALAEWQRSGSEVPLSAGQDGKVYEGRILLAKGIMSGKVRVINLEDGFPTRDQACQKLEVALARARKDGIAALKVIHGYGSTGAGGVLRFAIRGFLRQRKEKGEIAVFVNGESWSSFDARSKVLFAKVPDLILDSDVGRANKGITLVLL